MSDEDEDIEVGDLEDEEDPLAKEVEDVEKPKRKYTKHAKPLNVGAVPKCFISRCTSCPFAERCMNAEVTRHGR